jgi:nucleotide-binding universal stress UspA family protein
VFDPADYPLPDGYVVHTPEQLDRMTTEIQKRLEAARKDAESAGARRVSSRLIQGSAAQVILDLAREERFDLVVMGTHGRSGVGRWVLGFVAHGCNGRGAGAVTAGLRRKRKPSRSDR